MRKITTCSLMVLMLALVGCSDGPKLDHQGIYMLPKGYEPIEITSMKDSPGLLPCVMDSEFFDTEAQLIVYSKDLPLADSILAYLGDPRDTNGMDGGVVEVVVNPIGSDKYQIVAKTPLRDGIYMCGGSPESMGCFGIGNQVVELEVKAAFKKKYEQAVEESRPAE